MNQTKQKEKTQNKRLTQINHSESNKLQLSKRNLKIYCPSDNNQQRSVHNNIPRFKTNPTSSKPSSPRKCSPAVSERKSPVNTYFAGNSSSNKNASRPSSKVQSSKHVHFESVKILSSNLEKNMKQITRNLPVYSVSTHFGQKSIHEIQKTEGLLNRNAKSRNVTQLDPDLKKNSKEKFHQRIQLRHQIEAREKNEYPSSLRHMNTAPKKNRTSGLQSSQLLTKKTSQIIEKIYDSQNKLNTSHALKLRLKVNESPSHKYQTRNIVSSQVLDNESPHQAVFRYQFSTQPIIENIENFSSSEDEHGHVKEFQMIQTQRTVEHLSQVATPQATGLMLSGLRSHPQRSLPFGRSPQASTRSRQNNHFNQADQEQNINFNQNENELSQSGNRSPHMSQVPSDNSDDYNQVPASAVLSPRGTKVITSPSHNLNYESQDYLEMQEMIKKSTSHQSERERYQLNQGFISQNPDTEDFDPSWSPDQIQSGVISRAQSRTVTALEANEEHKGSPDVTLGYNQDPFNQRQDEGDKKLKDIANESQSSCSISQDIVKRKENSVKLTQSEKKLKHISHQMFFDPIGYLKSKPINCKKYHYQIQNCETYQAQITVSKDIKYLLLNKIRETDEVPETSLKGESQLKPYDSQSTYLLKDLTGFMFGGLSTRFWMQRQGILEIISSLQNSNPELIDKIMPHFEWECLTLQFRSKDLDIVIRDETHMNIMIKFLILYLNTFDGNKNSLRFLRRQNLICKKYSARQMLNRIFFGYKLMRFRMKIAYEACKKTRTIQEHILEAIVKAYYQRADKGLIEDPYPPFEQNIMEELFNSTVVEINSSKKVKNQCRKQCKFQIRKAQQNMKDDEERQREFTKKAGEYQFISNILSKSVSKTVRVDEMFDEYHKERNFNHLKGYKLTKERDEADQRAARIHKVDIARCHIQMQKLLMINKLGIIQGPLYCIILLEVIRIQKKLFALQLEDGNEKEIPQGIIFQGGSTPLSFQYYDWVYPIVKHHFNGAIKEQIIMKNRLKNQNKLTLFEALRQDFDDLQQNKSKEIDFDFNNEKFTLDKASQVLKKKFNSLFAKEDKLESKIAQKCQKIQRSQFLLINQRKLNRHIIPKNLSHENLKSQGIHNMLAKTEENDFNQIIRDENLFDEFCNLKERDLLEDFEIEINYMTPAQVKRKRFDLYKKKLMFQKQLMNLKEKGKRLQKIQDLNYIRIDLQTKMISQAAQIRMQNHLKRKLTKLSGDECDHIDIQLKKQIQKLSDIITDFDTKSRHSQEAAQQKMREKLIRDLGNCPNFNTKNKVLDKKIEFDQKFFDRGYAEFQLMISNTRKQIKLNEDILKLRQIIKKHKEIDERLEQQELKIRNKQLTKEEEAERLKEIQEERIKNYNLKQQSSNKIQQNLMLGKKISCKTITDDVKNQRTYKFEKNNNHKCNHHQEKTEKDKDIAEIIDSDEENNVHSHSLHSSGANSSQEEDFDIIGEAMDVPAIEASMTEIKSLLEAKKKKDSNQSSQEDIVTKNQPLKEQTKETIQNLSSKIEKRKKKIQKISLEQRKKMIDDAMHRAVTSKFRAFFENKEMKDLTAMLKDECKLDKDQKDSLMRMADKLFEKYDKDNSNDLDYNECKALFIDIFRKMGCPEIVKDDQFKLVYKQIDTDGSQTIEKSELIAFMVLLLS